MVSPETEDTCSGIPSSRANEIGFFCARRLIDVEFYEMLISTRLDMYKSTQLLPMCFHVQEVKPLTKGGNWHAQLKLTYLNRV